MELEQLRLSPTTKITPADKSITKNTRTSIECWDHCDKIKTISYIKGT